MNDELDVETYIRLRAMTHAAIGLLDVAEREIGLLDPILQERPVNLIGDRLDNAPHLVALVRAGAVFKDGKLIERPDGSEDGDMEMRDNGKSLKGIAAELNRLGIRQRRGGINWTPRQCDGPCGGQSRCSRLSKKWRRSGADIAESHRTRPGGRRTAPIR